MMHSTHWKNLCRGNNAKITDWYILVPQAVIQGTEKMAAKNDMNMSALYLQPQSTARNQLPLCAMSSENKQDTRVPTQIHCFVRDSLRPGYFP